MRISVLLRWRKTLIVVLCVVAAFAAYVALNRAIYKMQTSPAFIGLELALQRNAPSRARSLLIYWGDATAN